MHKVPLPGTRTHSRTLLLLLFLNKFYIFLSSHSPILISASCFLFPNCHSQFLEYGQFLGAMVCWLNHFFVVWVHLLQVTVHSAARHFICSVNRKVQQILFLNSVPITTYSQLFFACSLAVRIFIPWCCALSWNSLGMGPDQIRATEEGTFFWKPSRGQSGYWADFKRVALQKLNTWSRQQIEDLVEPVSLYIKRKHFCTFRRRNIFKVLYIFLLGKLICFPYLSTFVLCNSCVLLQ